MVRILNIVCLALIGLTVLGLYHVSEKTRVTQMELTHTARQIGEQRRAIAVLETEWQHVASPDRVQKLAGGQGMNDAASVQLSAFAQLPHRGEAPLNGSPVHNASVETTPTSPHGF
jgi:cell division protein FtsL